MHDITILITVFLVGINSSTIGSFLLLRKNVMMGDAISHAVLPGIFFAYFFSGGNADLPMLVGAAASGVFATVMITFLIQKARLQSDAAIGLSFTFLFSVGVVLISLFGKNIDLDPSCILFGELEYVPFNQWYIFGRNIGPKSTWILFFMSVLFIMVTALSFRALKLTTFDPNYAATLGVNASLWHYVLLSSVSLNTVISFEAVGSVLVIVFLAAPPAMAFLLTQNLKTMIVLAAILGMVSSAIGFVLAIWLNVSIAGSISVVMGLFLAVIFFIKKIFPNNVSDLDPKMTTTF
jgi:manganese/zinc/iron transport system permease protein